MQKQIEDEIRDEQKFAEEQDEKALAEYNDIVKRKKLQGIRKVKSRSRETKSVSLFSSGIPFLVERSEKTVGKETKSRGDHCGRCR